MAGKLGKFSYPQTEIYPAKLQHKSQAQCVTNACDKTLNIDAIILYIASCMGLSNVRYIATYVTEPGIRNTASAHNVVED